MLQFKQILVPSKLVLSRECRYLSKKHIPFAWALTLQHSSNNSSPLPELVFLKLIFLRIFFSGGLLLSDTGIKGLVVKKRLLRRNDTWEGKLAQRRTRGRKGVSGSCRLDLHPWPPSSHFLRSATARASAGSRSESAPRRSSGSLER